MAVDQMRPGVNKKQFVCAFLDRQFQNLWTNIHPWMRLLVICKHTSCYLLASPSLSDANCSEEMKWEKPISWLFLVMSGWVGLPGRMLHPPKGSRPSNDLIEHSPFT